MLALAMAEFLIVFISASPSRVLREVSRSCLPLQLE
jgi:hypothetical protein